MNNRSILATTIAPWHQGRSSGAKQDMSDTTEHTWTGLEVRKLLNILEQKLAACGCLGPSGSIQLRIQ